MPNEDSENKDLDKPSQPEAGESRAADVDINTDATHESDDLIVPSGEVAQQEAAALIRDAAGQLNDFLADRRRESEELARRMTRIEEEIQNNGNAGRHLTALSVVVAIIAFLATTGLWRLARHQSDVQSALQQTMTEVKASRDASMEAIGAGLGTVKEAMAGGIKGLEEELSGQREVATRLEQQLGETSQRVAGVREHVSRQIQQQSELTKSERDRMVTEIKTEISGLEDSLEERSRDLAKQSEELKSQQKEFSEATAKAKAERQAMIRAATETVNAQLLGLQTMLDTLDEEPASVANTEEVKSQKGKAGAKSTPKPIEKTEVSNKPAGKSDKLTQTQEPGAGGKKPPPEKLADKRTEKKPADKQPVKKETAPKKNGKQKPPLPEEEKEGVAEKPAVPEKSAKAGESKPAPQDSKTQ